MRLGEWIRTAGSGVPWMILALVANPAVAQFREVQPGVDSDQAVEIQLAPTQEDFVPPKLSAAANAPKSNIEPVPDGEPTPAADGTPTPAGVPQGDQQAAPQPATPQSALSQPSDAQPLAAQPQSSADARQPASPDQPVTEDETPEVNASIRSSHAFGAFRQPASMAGPTDAPTPKPIAFPLTFNEMTPGTSTLEQLTAQWGEPAKTIEDDAGKTLIYRAPGFQQVDVISAPNGRVIASIVVHLNESTDVEQLKDHLGLMGLRAVEITDETGTPLGRGYPERGILLSYAEASRTGQISHVALEPIRGELYRLRAETSQDENYTQTLADLQEATRIDPEDAKAYWLRAEILSLAGHSETALDAAITASRIESDNPLYQLTRARLAAGNGDLTEALLFTRNVAQDKSTSSLVRARAEYQLGNLIATGQEPDVQEALNHHLKAIDLAAKHARDKHVDARRMAKDILVDAHLAVAQDIALGSFQRQREVVPKWLTRATELAEEFISSDEGGEIMRMEIYRTTLAAYSVLEGNFDASIATEEAIKEGQRLVAGSQDRMFQFHVERELSETLYHAAKVEFRCGRLPTALKYVNNAVVLMEGDKAELQPSAFDRVMGGQLYFLIGSIYAMQDEDYEEAVKWFDKALPMFNDERLANLVDTSAFGDMFVSMGVSYWEVGERDKAIELTQAGAELIQDGVQAGSLQVAALSVPYGNLAAMHQHLGNGEKAKHFATMLAKVEQEDESIRR